MAKKISKQAKLSKYTESSIESPQIAKAFDFFKKWQPNFLFTWIIIFFVNYLRASELFEYPSFWAEDGPYFFKDSIELGFKSIYTPIVGHYHTIPRILSYIATFFPIDSIPLFYIVTAGIISSACCAYFVKDGFSWLIKNKWVRFVLAILISLLPGSEEIFFAYCTMNYILFIWITMYLIENYNGSSTQIKRREILFSTVWFSAGQGILFLPLIVFQIYRKNYVRVVSLITLILSVILNSVATKSLSNNSFNVSSFDLDKVPDLITVFFDNLFMRFLYVPLMNFRNAHFFAVEHEVLFYTLALIFIVIFVYRFLKSNLFDDFDLKISFILLLLTTQLVFVMIYLVRDYAGQSLFKEGIYFVGRYSMQPYFIALLIYVILFKSFIKSNKTLKIAAGVFTLFIFYNIFGYKLIFTDPRLAEFEQVWPTRAREITEAIDKVRIKKISTEEKIGLIRCRPIWWGDLGIKEITIKP